MLLLLNLVGFSVPEEVFVKSTEENQQHRDTGDQTHEEVQRRRREEERERKRRDVMEKLKRLSISSGDPEEPFSPLSPRSPSYMVSMASSSLVTKSHYNLRFSTNMTLQAFTHAC